ncbi:MAG: hypothetical protein QXN87_03595 [Candidatus Bathyarchaeia archaeon]
MNCCLERFIWLDYPSNKSMSTSRKICAVTVIAALCLGSNYALAGLPNFKFMDFLVFISGFVFGPIAGGSIGILIWMVYGVINPYGFVPQIWVATMLSESVYGFAGGFLGRKNPLNKFEGNPLSFGVFLGVIGLFLTFIYDLITNFVYAYALNIPLVIALITGVPFALVHQLSNTLIFGICSIPVITAIERFVGVGSFGLFKG